MADLIKAVLQSIFRELNRVEVIGVYIDKGSDWREASWRDAILTMRAGGNLKPVVVYGFESLDNLKSHEDCPISPALGVLYLRLPATIEEISKVFEKLKDYDGLPIARATEPHLVLYAVKKVRAFKHMCDNVWMSMSANANGAKKSIENTPEIFPEALREFRSNRIKRLLEDYKDVEQMAIRLGIEGADQGQRILQNVIEKIEQIESNRVSPRVAVDLAFRCVEKLQDLSKIAERAKELDQSG